MKIIYGITKSNFGGAQRYVYDLATEAKRAGHDVSVICGAGGVLVEKLKEQGVRVMEIKEMKRDISLVDEFRSLHFIFRTLFREKPDIFHANSSKMGGLGALAARLAGVRRIVFTAHGWAFNEPRPSWQKPIIKFFSWLTVLLSHQTICVSEKTREEIEGWPFIRNKLRVVYNGIRPFALLPRAEARQKLGIPQDSFVVGTLSELHPVKGLDILLEAWEHFTVKNPEAKLVMLGEGEWRENLEELAKVLAISDSVEMKGYVENARAYLKAFDLFCLPSRSEAMPYAVLEAGFAGVPVVATNVGGIPEMIETGTDGALVDPEEPDSLFSTLLLLSESPELRERLGKALENRVRTHFLLDNTFKETLKIYLK